MYHVPRSAYYRWIKDPGSYRERMNQKIADTIKKSMKNIRIWDTAG